MPYDLISIGDTVIDTYLPVDEAKILHDGNVEYLGLKYGFKIPVEEGMSIVAGNAANNAVGSSRLGLKTAIYTNVGNKDDDQDDDLVVDLDDDDDDADGLDPDDEDDEPDDDED